MRPASTMTTRIRKKVNDIVLYAVILFVALIVIVTQNNKVGFEPGHHGWVSAHALAIISKATANNQFVGHTMSLKDDKNNIRYYYFDRAPVFFSLF